MACFFFWLVSAVLDWALLLFVWWPFAPIVSLFTRKDDWGWFQWFGTWDNPPQGDEGFNKLEHGRTEFPGVYDGWQGWWNRTRWLWRNPGYGYAKFVSIHENDILRMKMYGNQDISDKYGIPGIQWVRAYDDFNEFIAFEFYCVFPYPFRKDKCFRARLGWKLSSSKLHEYGFAQLVNSIHPWKDYGKN